MDTPPLPLRSAHHFWQLRTCPLLKYIGYYSQTSVYGGGRVVGDEEDKEDGDADEESSIHADQTVGEDSFEGLGDEDDEGPEAVEAQQSRAMKEIGGFCVTLTARQRAMQTSKDVDRLSAPLIEYPEGLTNLLPRSTYTHITQPCWFL